MSDPSEPEKYSIDDMMERLKKASPDEDPTHEGEWVTRADGSQAIRVRRRKRRTQQPHKEARSQSRRRLHMLQLAALMLVGFLALGGGGMAIILANSPPFRSALIEKIQRCTGANAELTRFRMTPSKAHAERLTLTWPAGQWLGELVLSQPKADIHVGAFLGRTFFGEDVTCTNATLSVRIDSPARISELPTPAAAPPIRFVRYATPKGRITFGPTTGAALTIRDAETSFYQQEGANHAKLLLSRGTLTIPGWPAFSLDRSHIEFSRDEIRLLSLRLQHAADERGVLSIRGDLDLADGHSSTLPVELESFPLAGLTGPDLGRLLVGRVETRHDDPANHLRLDPRNLATTALELGFQNSPSSSLELGGLPFLLEIARWLDDDWFERPVFNQDIRGKFVAKEGKIELLGLNMENKGRMALRGNLTLQPDRSLTGRLRVGISQAMIQSAANTKFTGLFTESSDGFRWLDLELSGTGTAPRDNFKELLLALPSAPPPPAGPANFKSLTQPE